MMNPTEVRAAIEAALFYANGEVTTDDVMNGLADGTYTLFEFPSGWVIVTVIQYERTKALRIAIANGDLSEQPEVLSALEQCAELNSCDYLEIYGRRGWARQLKPFGYTEQYVVVTKPVRRPQ
ncbi:MAG: putative acetyltransferase [Siphoviridae sp. ct7UA22]|nr:MAG: putative acetyltransferase [Siphoviridae sp. ct7UA22]